MYGRIEGLRCGVVVLLLVAGEGARWPFSQPHVIPTTPDVSFEWLPRLLACHQLLHSFQEHAGILSPARVANNCI